MSIFDTINRNVNRFTTRVSGGGALSTPIITPEERKLPFEDFIKKLNGNLNRFQAKQTPLTMTPQDVSRRITSGIEALNQKRNIFQSAVGIGQEITKSTGSIGLLLTGKRELAIKSSDPKWQQTIQRAIFGDEPVESFGLRTERFPERAAGFGISEAISRPIAPFAVGLITALDLTGLGGEKNVVRLLARSKSVSFITKTLKQIGVADDIILPAAQKIATITDEKEIKLAIDKISELQKTTKVAPGIKSTTQATKAEPLAQEARKLGEVSPLKMAGETGRTFQDLLKDSPAMLKGRTGFTIPPKTVTIYKGVSKSGLPIKTGDWVTTNKGYAKQFGKVLEKLEVPAEELRYMRGAFKGNAIGEYPEYILTQATKGVEPLAQEARKYKSAEEFSKAWDIDGMRGRYWHITDSPNFKISKDISPKDATSIGMGQKGGEGLIVSSVPSQWLPYARNRKYISEIDLSKAKPNVDYTIVNRGFGQEVFIKNLDAVSVKSTKPIKQGMADVRNWEKAEFKNKEEAIDFYTQATKGVEKVADVGKTERGFISSAKKIVPKAETRIAGQYVPRATDSLAIKARNLIIDDIALAEKIALTRSDDIAVATASELLKKYADDAAKSVDQSISNALYDKAADVANTLAPKLTEQGRSIQAASILGRLTPEGQVRFAAREIQRWNELNPLKKVPELTGPQSKHILDEMKIINQMPEGVEKASRFQKLQKHIQDLVPTPLLKKVIAVWKAGLLTGIKTQGLNLFSNISHGITEVIKDIPAALVDNAASLFTGKRAKVATIRGAFKGIKEGVVKGKRYFVTGFDERNIAAKLDYKRVNFGKGKVAKTFQVYTDTVFRFLGAADQPFYYAAMSRSLMDQALALGMTKGLKGKKLVEFAYKVVDAPTEEMIRYGVADATTAVFQNQTKLGEAAAAIQKIPGIGEIILPFGRTPSSVAMQIINYSPAGIAKTIIENIGKGKFDQRLFSQGIGRGLTGTGVIFIGMEMAKKGMISLDYPQGDEREQELQKAGGVKNNAILINGKWRTPIVLGPAGNLLLIGGHFQKAIEEEGSPTEAMTKGIAGSMSSFLEQTFLTGVKSSVNAITDPERYAKTYLPNLVASFVPTVVSDVARATDPKERRTEGVLQRIQSRIPGLRKGTEPQVTILGEEKERIGNPLEVLIDPSRPSPQKKSPVINELGRLMNKGFRVSPTALGNRQGYKVLTQEENTFLWKYAGQILNDKLTDLFSNEEYQNASDKEKADVIDDYVRNGKLIARVGMVVKLTQDLEGEELSNKLKELKEGGFLIKSVYKKWLELR